MKSKSKATKILTFRFYPEDIKKLAYCSKKLGIDKSKSLRLAIENLFKGFKK